MSLELDLSKWQRVKFSDIAQSVNDRVDDPQTAGVDRYVGLEHLDPGSMTVNRWGSPDQVEATKLRFKPGDVIFGRRRAYQKKVARADFEGICSAHAMVLRAKPECVEPDFLPVFLSCDYFLDRAIQISVGSLSPTVNWKTLSSQEFDLPPIDQQRQIADLLWASENERAATEIELKAVTTTLVAVTDRYFGVSSDSVPLGSLALDNGIRIGPFGAQLHAADYVDTGVPVVMPQDMLDNKISDLSIQRVSESKANELAVYRLLDGDILLPRRGELNRRALASLTHSGWLCGTGSVRVRLRAEVSSLAVLRSLSSRSSVAWLERNATGTTMPNLNASIVKRIPVTVPKGDSLLEAMTVCDEFDTAKRMLEARLGAVSSFHAILLNYLFGEAE